jgi:hypothetical protein
MKYCKAVLLLVFLFSIAACQKAPESQLVVFLEKESGIDPYQTRIIVTPTVVRFDDGEGSRSYLIFDRKNRVARNVDLDNKTVLEMYAKKVKIEPPVALHYTVKDLGDLQDAPKIMGKSPRHYQDLANDQLCFDVIAVDKLMPEAVEALKEFQELLASDSAVTFNSIPADMRDPCSMSMSTFAPARYLMHGFPIQQWRPGYSRTLIDYKEHYQADPKLFVIPDGLFTYSLQQVRDGVVDLENHKIRTETKQ